MPKIAISYRRTDTDATGRIYDRLVQRYGKDSIFRDIDRIRFGVDFRKAINEALNDTDVLLAIVGSNWRGVAEDGSIRIKEANDLVRIEVETALKRDIPVIPVLISNAAMPKPTELPETLSEFSFRNAASVDSGRNFDTDIERLMRSMDSIIEEKEKSLAQEEAAVRQEEAERERKRAEEERLRKEAERIEQERRDVEKRQRQEQERRKVNAKASTDEDRRRKADEQTQQRPYGVVGEDNRISGPNSRINLELTPSHGPSKIIFKSLGLLLVLNPFFVIVAFQFMSPGFPNNLFIPVLLCLITVLFLFRHCDFHSRIECFEVAKTIS